MAASGLLDEARALSGDLDKLSQAVSDRVGLSSRELLAMDLISRNGQVTAGELAEELHLTSGAITGLIDRLERAGFARRVSDPNDRRRVLVAATAKEKRIAGLYEPLAAGLRRTVDAYSEQELATLTDFLRKLRAVIGGAAEGLRPR
jgi:DNA-binding MarR family transcriptional regulator